MSDKELEELDLDNGSVNDETENEAEDHETSEEQSDKKKNKSNWKELYKKAKLADKLREEKEQLEAELEEWRNTNPEILEEKQKSSDMEEIKDEVFLSKNPDAEEYMDEVKKTMRKFSGISRKDAWEFVKMKLPKESRSKSDFSLK